MNLIGNINVSPESDIGSEQWLMLGLLGLAALLVFGLLRLGVLGPRAFDRAPARDGTMLLVDLIMLVGLVLLGYSVVSIAAAAMGGGEGPDLSDPRVVWLQYALQLPAVAFVLIRAHSAMRGGLSGFGFSLAGFSATCGRTLLAFLSLVIILLGLGYVTIWISIALTGEPPPQIAHKMLRSILEGDPKVRLLLIVPAVVIAPVYEEIMYRGMLQTALLHTGLLPGRWSVILVASVIFVIPHTASVEWQALPTLFVLSMGMGYVYERTGRLWASILIHMLFNAANVALAFVQSWHATPA